MTQDLQTRFYKVTGHNEVRTPTIAYDSALEAMITVIILSRQSPQYVIHYAISDRSNRRTPNKTQQWNTKSELITGASRGSTSIYFIIKLYFPSC